MPKYICEHCMKEARLMDKDMRILNYLAERKDDPVDKWDVQYSKYSIRQMERNLNFGRSVFYTRMQRLKKMGLVEQDKFRVLNKGGRYPVMTYRLTKEGKRIMGVK